MYLEKDCNLNGEFIKIDDLSVLTSKDISKIIGVQNPGANLEYSEKYDWSFHMIPIEQLRYSNEDGDEPDDGWESAYFRHKKNDDENVKNRSPEYAGRQEWLTEWAKDTRKYPLYIVQEDDRYRLLDGYHRLAGAFFEKITHVACFVGKPLILENKFNV